MSPSHTVYVCRWTHSRKWVRQTVGEESPTYSSLLPHLEPHVLAGHLPRLVVSYSPNMTHTITYPYFCRRHSNNITATSHQESMTYHPMSSREHDSSSRTQHTWWPNYYSTWILSSEQWHDVVTVGDRRNLWELQGPTNEKSAVNCTVQNKLLLLL